MSTEFQTRLYNYISDYIQRCNYSPRFTEITEAMGISPRSKSLITRNLRALSKEGKVILQKDGRRLLIKLRNNKMPLVGKISAGSPIEAIEEQDSLDVAEYFHGDNQFALRVSGDSMIEDGILDGDYIICKQANTANEGDIVVALIDQCHTTLKHISYKIHRMITLIPANASLKPRCYAPDRIQIQGIYLGLIRLRG